MRTPVRLLGLALSVLLLIACAGGFWLYRRLDASLPQLDGQARLPGLAAPVTVSRDSLGIPTLHGANRLDIARATGFIHAQDRFFQMDLLRRLAAGELAELLGEAGLEQDQTARLHRFRALAHAYTDLLPAADRELLDTYTAGVNAGLADLAQPPFEYLLLDRPPSPWRAEDTLLVSYAMYLDLQGPESRRESMLGVMHAVLPERLYEFLAPAGTDWDAPLDGRLLEPPPLPGPEVLDLRRRPESGTTLGATRRREPPPPLALGSNNWAVAGAHTRHGGALLANDMHLAHQVPNIWYRLSLIYPDRDGHERRITGVTLPGVPVMVIGSNGRIAWGLTNSQGDWSDLVVLEPAIGGDYLTPDGPRAFQYFQETIQVKDGPPRTVDIPWTIWGPVVDQDHQGRRRALRWVAHDRPGVNLEMLRLESAGTVQQAVAVAQEVGAPAQNFVVADAQGQIAWTIMGPIPRRFGHDGRLPQSWADGRRGWDGWLTPAEYPRIVNPPAGRLWTANARAVGGTELAKLGFGGYDLGARARQIRDALFALEQPDEAAMLALQLDDRALFLERWRGLLLEVLTPQTMALDPRRRELRRLVEDWGGRAAVDSAGYRLVRSFRWILAGQVFAPLTAACRQADGRFDYAWIEQRESPLWRLVTERPAHLLDPRHGSWREQLLAAVDALLEQFAGDGVPLAQQTWGERNTVHIRHPLSAALPGLDRWLDMAPVPLPGDHDMPRVQTPRAGASQRMVVAPGRESEGIFHMPVGQSGHPWSPYYRSGQRAWERGEPSPFLPGPAVHRLTLRPGS